MNWGKILRRFHLWAMIAWLVVISPLAMIFWRDAIWWINIMSLYAIVIAHWSAYQGSRAEKQAKTDD